MLVSAQLHIANLSRRAGFHTLPLDVFSWGLTLDHHARRTGWRRVSRNHTFFARHPRPPPTSSAHAYSAHHLRPPPPTPPLRPRPKSESPCLRVFCLRLCFIYGFVCLRWFVEEEDHHKPVFFGKQNYYQEKFRLFLTLIEMILYLKCFKNCIILQRIKHFLHLKISEWRVKWFCMSDW